MLAGCGCGNGDSSTTARASFDFSGGKARPGEMIYTRVWFRSPDEALAHARPTVRFDVLDGQTVIARGEVVSR